MDYLECISTFFPNVFVECSGDSSLYENIIWVSGSPLPTKAILDDLIYKQAKLDKITELSNACQLDIIGGFTSNALGALNKYDSTEVDQLNLIGAVTATSPTPTDLGGYNSVYACRPIINGVEQSKQYLLHSHFQLRQVLADGAAYKLNELLNFNNKRTAVNNATTIAEINAITWSSVS